MHKDIHKDIQEGLQDYYAGPLPADGPLPLEIEELDRALQIARDPSTSRKARGYAFASVGASQSIKGVIDSVACSRDVQNWIDAYASIRSCMVGQGKWCHAWYRANDDVAIVVARKDGEPVARILVNLRTRTRSPQGYGEPVGHIIRVLDEAGFEAGCVLPGGWQAAPDSIPLEVSWSHSSYKRVRKTLDTGITGKFIRVVKTSSVAGSTLSTIMHSEGEEMKLTVYCVRGKPRFFQDDERIMCESAYTAVHRKWRTAVRTVKATMEDDKPYLDIVY